MYSQQPAIHIIGQTKSSCSIHILSTKDCLQIEIIVRTCLLGP